MTHTIAALKSEPTGAHEIGGNSALAPTFSLGSLTPAERAANQQKAAATRAANVAARAASPLRTDFLDDAFWMDLARRYAVRLPAWGIPITSGRIQRYLRKLGYSVEWYQGWQGEKSLGEFARLNPRWPMRALVGLLLEEREDDDRRAAKAAK